MSSRQIAIIDPAISQAELDCYNHLVLQSPLPLTYHLPAMFGLDSLRSATAQPLAGIVILGSASSVYDCNDWQKELEAWLLPHLQRGTPTLGLCYGHQLLAHVTGAKVDFAFSDQRKFLGWRDVTLAATALTGGSPVKGPLVVSHREVVTECPKGWKIVGHSPEVAVEAIAHERLPLWGIQAHAEATDAFLKNQNIPSADPGLFTLGHGIMKRFLELAKSC